MKKLVSAAVPFLIATMALMNSSFAAEEPRAFNPGFKTQPIPHTATKLKDLGVTGLRIDSLRIVESSDNCQWKYEITVINKGFKATNGIIGLSSSLKAGVTTVSGGSNTLNIDGLGVGHSKTDIKPLMADSDPKFSQLTVNLTNGAKIVDTRTINLPNNYTGQLVDVTMESGKFKITAKNTSGVATSFFAQLHKPDPVTSTGWRPAGGRAFQCINAGQTLTVVSPTPSGWPTNPSTIKVLLKSGNKILGEKTLVAP